VQLSLARKQELAQRLAKLTDVGGLDDGGGDQVSPIARRLVNEHMYGHPHIVPYSARLFGLAGLLWSIQGPVGRGSEPVMRPDGRLAGFALFRCWGRGGG
jgi:hypothetical protein